MAVKARMVPVLSSRRGIRADIRFQDAGHSIGRNDDELIDCGIALVVSWRHVYCLHLLGGNRGLHLGRSGALCLARIFRPDNLGQHSFCDIHPSRLLEEACLP